MKNRMILAAVACAFTLLLAESSQATLALVNDFDGTGTFNSNGDVAIDADPDDAGNNALKITGASGAFDAHVGGFTIADNSVGTLFVRVRLTDFSVLNPGTRGGFGPTDMNWTDADAAGQDRFNSRVFVESVREFGPPRRTQTGAYNGNTKTAGNDSVQDGAPGAWQNFWFVLDTTADTFDLYVEGGSFLVQTQVADDYSWYRDDLKNADGIMRGFYVQGSSSVNNVAYYDDIYVDATGVDLTNPLTAVPEPSSFLFGLMVLGLTLRQSHRKVS